MRSVVAIGLLSLRRAAPSPDEQRPTRARATWDDSDNIKGEDYMKYILLIIAGVASLGLTSANSASSKASACCNGGGCCVAKAACCHKAAK
jgi:hypothetical protein